MTDTRSLSSSPREALHIRGDGTTAQTAYWTRQLWNNPRQRQYLVHRRAPNQWIRCTEQEAQYEADTGYTVWELGTGPGRRVNLLAGKDGRTRFLPFDWQYDHVVAEERARVERREPIPGEEDLLDGKCARPCMSGSGS